jgi:hypothetical protein
LKSQFPLQLIGEQLAEIKRLAISEIDTDILRLKRTVLEEKLAQFNQQMLLNSQKDKSNKLQELNSRRLGNSSLVSSAIHALENAYNSQLLVATTGYNRAIEEIALLERKIAENNMNCFRRIQRFFGFSSASPRL